MSDQLESAIARLDLQQLCDLLHANAWLVNVPLPNCQRLPLVLAASLRGGTELCRALVHFGASSSKPSHFTPLHAACEAGNLETVHFLLEHDAATSTLGPEQRRLSLVLLRALSATTTPTPRALALAQQHYDIVNLLDQRRDVYV